MIKSLLAVLLLIYLYIWSSSVLHLNVFLLDRFILNFLLLYIPTLIFYSSIFLDITEVFREVQRLLIYSFVPVIAFRVGWYGFSFNFSFTVCFAISNLIKPNFSKRFPIIIFNGLALIIFLMWRA